MVFEIIGLICYEPLGNNDYGKRYDSPEGWRIVKSYKRGARVQWLDKEFGFLQVNNEERDSGTANFVGYDAVGFKKMAIKACLCARSC
jgi:hypothetical protein